MEKIAVFPNASKAAARLTVERIVNFMVAHKVRPMLPRQEARYLGYSEYGHDLAALQAADMVLSVGGDGTFLGVCRSLGDSGVPLCGINIGTLGFMADIEPDELEEKLQKILSGEYKIEERLRLAGFIRQEGSERYLGSALNDIVVTKGGSMARMLHLGLSLNGTRLIDYKADGLIVSTPVGSTAYSLSAGGPILNPKLKSLLLTPICAHTFNLRPIVVDEDDTVCIHIAEMQQDTQVALDGQESFRLRSGDEVIVKKSPMPIKLVKFADKDYYKILRTKLWRKADDIV